MKIGLLFSRRGVINLLLVIVLLQSNDGLSQNETVTQLNYADPSNHVSETHKIGGHIFLLTRTYNSVKEIHRFQVNTGTIDTITTDNYSFNHINYNSKGIFYFNDGLCFEDTLGNKMESFDIGSVVNSGSNKSAPIVCNDRYYIHTRLNNELVIWESDGTVAGTQVIYQTSNEIRLIDHRNDTLLVVEDDGNDYHFSHYTSGSTMSEFASVPMDDHLTYLMKSGTSDNHIYYFGKDTSGLYHIMQVDFQNQPTSFLNTTGRLRFEGNTFFLLNGYSEYYGEGKSRFIVKGNIQNTTQLDTLHFKNEITSTPSINGSSAIIDYVFEGNFFRIRSHKLGYEMVRIDDQDSIAMAGMHNYGPSSSFLDKKVDVSSFVYPTEFYFEDATLYGLLTNGNDTKYYIYELKEEDATSLFPVDDPDGFAGIWRHENFIYWVENKEGFAVIKRRDINSGLEPQPTTKPASTSWFQQVGNCYGNDPIVGSGSVFLYLSDAELDADGNAIVAYNSNRDWSQLSQVYGDTSIVTQHRGAQLIVKFDTHGNYVWSNGIGNDNGFGVKENEIAVRPNGNIVVVGQFYQFAYFDQDSLTAPRSGYYLAELDGQTGTVLWKKIIGQEIWLDEIEPERISLDENGNMYVAFLCRDFNVTIGGVSVNSNKNRHNVLAKFDATGNTVWVQSLYTPWTDYYGFTHVLDYNEEYQTITTVTSQGAYNVSSSCEYQEWDYYIQEFTPDGVLNSAYEFTGSDLGAMTVGARTKNNDFFGFGYFRSELTTDHFTLNTAPEGGCYAREMFAVIYDSQERNIKSAGATSNNTLYPLDMAITDEHMYIFGLAGDDSLTVIRLDHDGNFKGFKKLNQTKNKPDSWISDYFDANEDYLLFAGSYWRNPSVLGWRPDFSNAVTFSMLKIANADWRYDQEFIQFADADLPDGTDGLLLYPNPFTTEITIVQENLDQKFSAYSIIDQTGRAIQSGTLEGKHVQKISILPLSSGMYSLILSSEEGKISKPLIRL